MATIIVELSVASTKRIRGTSRGRLITWLLSRLYMRALGRVRRQASAGYLLVGSVSEMVPQLSRDFFKMGILFSFYGGRTRGTNFLSRVSNITLTLTSHIHVSSFLQLKYISYRLNRYTKTLPLSRYETMIRSIGISKKSKQRSTYPSSISNTMNRSITNSMKIGLSMMAVTGAQAQAQVNSRRLRRELEGTLNMPLSINTMPGENDHDIKIDEETAKSVQVSNEQYHQDKTPDSGITSLSGLIMNINNNKKSLHDNVENVMKAVGIVTDDSIMEIVEAFSDIWQALPRDSKCNVLRDIFTLPAFGKKLDKWLELACPGKDKPPTTRATILSTINIELVSSIKETEAVRKLQTTNNAGLTDVAVGVYLTTIQETIENSVPAGTTVVSVTLISITEVNGSLKFDTQIILDVVCNGPCDEAQAESDALAQVNSSLDTSISDGSFSTVLTGNLSGVTDCGTAFPSCDDLATANTEVTVQVCFHIIFFCFIISHDVHLLIYEHLFIA